MTKYALILLAALSGFDGATDTITDEMHDLSTIVQQDINYDKNPGNGGEAALKFAVSGGLLTAYMLLNGKKDLTKDIQHNGVCLIVLDDELFLLSKIKPPEAANALNANVDGLKTLINFILEETEFGGAVINDLRIYSKYNKLTASIVIFAKKDNIGKLNIAIEYIGLLLEEKIQIATMKMHEKKVDFERGIELAIQEEINSGKNKLIVELNNHSRKHG